MTDAAAFLRAIIAEPDDDLPRLVLADWLDERGDPRGEFIRVQCELATLPDSPLEAPSYRGERVVLAPAAYAAARSVLDPHADRRDALRRRERELLDEHAYDWFEAWTPGDDWHGMAAVINTDGTRHHGGWIKHEPSPDGQTVGTYIDADFTRGFVSSVTLSWADFQTHATALLAACPIRRVNRPRACPACGGDGESNVDAAGPPVLPCARCRGTGTVDDWRGDGVVRLTSLPAIDLVRQTSNGYVQRIRGGRCEVETGYGEPYESVFLKAANAEYPGVWFGLPEPQGVDGLTAREVAQRLNAATGDPHIRRIIDLGAVTDWAECEWEEVGPAAAVICQCHREPVRQGRDWDAAGPPRQVEVLRLESHAYHQAGDVYHVSVAQCPHCRRVHYTRPRRGASLVTGGRP